MAKVLFIRYKKAQGVKDGGEVGHAAHFAAMCELFGRENVTDYAVNDLTRRRSVRELLSGVVGMVFGRYMGLSNTKLKEIERLATDCDYVLIDRSVFGYIAKYLKERGVKATLICFFHNVEEKYFADKMGRWVPWRWLVLWCVDSNDRMSCDYADKILALNSRDSEEIERRYGRKADGLIPVTVEDKATAPTEEKSVNERLKCLFVGAYFTANVEGIQWFMNEVMPLTDVELTVVGKGMLRLKPEKSDVRVLSDVPDLRPVMEEADVVVLPIFKGSGMKVKTCESLMWGKNIVGSKEAFVGYDVDKKAVGGECETAQEFVTALSRIREERWSVWNPVSRSAYEKQYSHAAMMKSWRSIFGLD